MERKLLNEAVKPLKLKIHSQKKQSDITGRRINKTSVLRLFRDCFLAGIIAYILFGQVFGIAFEKGEPGAEAGNIIIFNRLNKRPKVNDTAIIAAFSGKRYLAGRVIAESGDKIDINNKADALVVSGNRSKKSYKIENTADGRGTIDYPTTVPVESIFILGDEGGKALDSRRIGVVNLRRVAGTALFIFKMP
ncbi:hypothetical protein CCDG5_1268 [[Clostridium] cellulosi]|uniref:Signal peptidase I n=1 Tax=[Clostridium] cellulosi TaxID=29343 RepID=A0A078KPF2_9FIRM|nr:hypothetical protein CCDG5_1268 [[Clostridium] cellulosi]